jgi:hypothetical protein
MDINGLEGKSRSQLQAELNRGGKFVIYLWVVSILIYTWKRPSAIYYIPRSEEHTSELQSQRVI